MSSPGVPSTLPTVTAQLSTQTNPGFPSMGISSVVQSQQNLAVAGPNYSSPGKNNIGNPAGGGP
jgi:hypothetical protein